MNPTQQFTLIALLAASHALPAFAETPRILTTPDKVETPLGTLEFKDGAPPGLWLKGKPAAAAQPAPADEASKSPVKK